LIAGGWHGRGIRARAGLAAGIGGTSPRRASQPEGWRW
jgi:hypothetical protein